MVIVGKQLDRLMRRAGIRTQTELAAAMGQHHQALNRVIRGRSEPGMQTVARLCRVLKAQPGDFLRYQDALEPDV